jgi:hypothetical protein
MLPLSLACAAAPPPPPPARTRADAHEARLRAAFSTPGTWSGPGGTIEVTDHGTVRVDRAVDGQGELALIGVEGPYVVLQQTEPMMPVYAPAWLDDQGGLHLGAFFSNRVHAAVDDAGRADYPFTPAHHLRLDASSCVWEDQLAPRALPIPCATSSDGGRTRIRFTVPPGGFGPWEGDHEAVWVPADGVLIDPEVEAATFTRR